MRGCRFQYRPCPLLVKYVEAVGLGRKTKRGFTLSRREADADPLGPTPLLLLAWEIGDPARFERATPRLGIWCSID